MQNFFDRCLVVVPMLAGKTQTHTFARQRASDENRLAVDMRHTTAVVGKIGDIGFENGHAKVAHPPCYSGLAEEKPGSRQIGRQRKRNDSSVPIDRARRWRHSAHDDPDSNCACLAS